MPAAALTGLAAQLDAALPQTQCTRCGYVDCQAYALAMADGQADINRCPPGGDEGMRRLARIAGRPPLALDAGCGIEGPRWLAVIDEAWCIGCTLCIKACPVDAIMGINKMMHTVIESCCTGCELCLPVCPVDCISLENVTGNRTGWNAWSQQDADTARIRYEFHSYKQLKNMDKSAKAPEEPQQAPAPQVLLALAQPMADGALVDRKRAVIEGALARARAQRENKT